MKVSVTIDGKAVGTLTVDGFRPVLVSARMGNGKHTITYPIPARFKDGKPHSYKIRI